jgi:two-component system cell cycle sensor histidine kinase/response regulator CckA
VSLAGTIHNVTEQRAAQRRQSELERQLLHAQKLDVLGTLAGGIAHDLNNTLVPVLGLAKLTMARLAEGSRERTNVAIVLHAGERVRDLVRQILAFSRKDVPTRDAVDFATLLRETLKMLRASLPAAVEIDEAIDDVPPVLADPAQ